MIIFPAIDLHEGKCVRLYKGDYATAHKVAEDAVVTALSFKSAGAEMIHMVDLNGAKSGKRVNGEIIRRVIAETGMRVQIGGGVRSMADAEELDGMGVYRFIIGSAAVYEPEFVRSAVSRYGTERVAVSLDCNDGVVMTDGWTKSSGRNYLEFAKTLEGVGLKTIIFTDIEMDGTLSGPSMSALKRLMETVGCDIIASGGVGNIEDVWSLRELGVSGAIIGKAIYTGDVELSKAIALARGDE